MVRTNRHGSIVVGLALIGATQALAGGPTMSFEATAINGEAIPGAPADKIEAYPGDTIVAKVYIADWSPQGETVSAYQAQLEPIDFKSGTSGRIAPYDYDEARTRSEPNRDHAFIDQAEPDFIHRRLHTLAITDSISLGYRWASVLLDGRLGPGCAQDGRKFYAGTVHLQVSSDASGTFKLGFIESPDSCGMRDGKGGYITPIEFKSLTITVHDADIVQLVDALNGQADGKATLQPNELGDLIRRFNRPDGAIENGTE